MEEQRLFNSKVMWEILPRNRLGIKRLVEALNGAFNGHLVNEYHHWCNNTGLTL